MSVSCPLLDGEYTTQSAVIYFYELGSHDRDAPTNFGAMHTPSFVRILCTLLVAGFTHAAS